MTILTAGTINQLGQIVNSSLTTMDALTGPNTCGAGDNALPGFNPATLHAQGRCGYGPRLPLMAISPFAKQNYVDSGLTDLSSILRFIENNWLDYERVPGGFDSIAGSIYGMFDFYRPNYSKFILDPSTGQPVK